MPRQSPSGNYRCGKAESKLNVIWLKSMSLIVEQSLFIVQKYCHFFPFSCTVFVVALLPLPPICLCFLFHQGVIKQLHQSFLLQLQHLSVMSFLEVECTKNITHYFEEFCKLFIYVLLTSFLFRRIFLLRTIFSTSSV